MGPYDLAPLVSIWAMQGVGTSGSSASKNTHTHAAISIARSQHSPACLSICTNEADLMKIRTFDRVFAAFNRVES